MAAQEAAMTDAVHDIAPDIADDPALNPPGEVRTHRESFETFLKFALFAVMHVGLVLVCLALGFLGHAAVLALLLGLGGTAALVLGFLIFA
jgi:hypothetical protein